MDNVLRYKLHFIFLLGFLATSPPIPLILSSLHLSKCMTVLYCLRRDRRYRKQK